MLVFLVALIRVAYVLGANPVGELAQELFYLRFADLRLPLLVVVGILSLEAIEFTIPVLVNRGLLQDLPVFAVVLGATQATLLALASFLVLRFANRYTIRAFEARIDENMEKIAHLQTQKRRVTRLAETERSNEE